MRLPFEGNYAVTLPFGSSAPPYNSTHTHRGTDYGCPTGTELLSPQDGYAQQMEADDFGHNTQIDGDRYLVILAHESIHLGDGWVFEGQPVGYSGMSGYASGPHVHVQVLDKETGQWVNFEKLIGGNVDEINNLKAIASARADYLNQIAYAAGVDPNNNPIEADDVAQIIANIDKKNKRILELESTSNYEIVDEQLYRRKK